MSHIIDTILDEIRSLVGSLGKDGGLISPSVYDTAQVLRLHPPQKAKAPALDWLIDQCQADDGWGDPSAPLTRDVPTLASVLALHACGDNTTTRDAVQRGLAFLRRQADQWRGPLPDDIPVGVELLLPKLLNEAVTVGLALPEQPYASLITLGKQRHELIARSQLQAGTPLIHSWEAWGVHPEPHLIDHSGGVGHSPAATAAWLHAAARGNKVVEHSVVARRYLDEATAATQVGIDGVVPTVWPITRFEQVFVLFSLLAARHLNDSRLADVVNVEVNKVFHAFQTYGLGMSDFFLPDGDNTSVALAVLRAVGYDANRALLQRFETGNHYSAYIGEQQPSLSLTAHALHALALFGERPANVEAYVLNHQLPDGRWLSDKWHSSWIYTTAQVIMALDGSRHINAIRSGVDALLAHQHRDGGWGIADTTAEETAHAVLALHYVRHRSVFQHVTEPLQRAQRWLLDNYQPSMMDGVKRWIGKETYRPLRIARAFELSALLALTSEDGDE